MCCAEQGASQLAKHYLWTCAAYAQLQLTLKQFALWSQQPLNKEPQPQRQNTTAKRSSEAQSNTSN